MTIRFAASTIAFVIFSATAANADCISDIQAILKSTETSPPYHVEITSTAGDSTTKMQGEVIMPHSMQIKSTEMNMVMTPNGVWMGKGEALKKMPDGMREQMQAMIKQGISLGMSAIEAPECAGSVSFEGGNFTLYKYIAKGEMMGIKSTSNVDMYVNADNRPEWMMIDGEAMGTKSQTKQHIVYDDSITIADPK
jgi:hypothetical protein